MWLKILQKTPKSGYIVFKPSDDIKKVIAAVKNAPNPQISPDMDVEIPAKNALICMQNETVIGRKSSTMIDSVGTVRLASCIFILFENADNYLAMHIDSPYEDYSFAIRLKKFTSLEDIKVTLIGGHAASNNDSERTLYNIITELLKLSEIVPIEIRAQHLLEDNKFKPSGKAAFIRDVILTEAPHFYEKLYAEKLDISEFKQHKSSELETNHSPNWGVQIRTIALAAGISQLQCISMDSGVQTFKSIENSFRIAIPNKEVFKETLHNIFIFEIYEKFKALYENAGVFYQCELTNFVINLKTGRINHVSLLIDTPYRATRTLFMYQKGVFNSPYPIVFENDRYIPPKLPDKVHKLIERISPMIQRGLETDELKNQIKNAIPTFDLVSYHLNHFCMSVKELPFEMTPAPSMETDKPVTFSYNGLFSNQYVCRELIDKCSEVKKNECLNF